MGVDHQEQPPPDPRVVVGVDASESSPQALERAPCHAEVTGGALGVITTWAVPVTYEWSPQIPVDWGPLSDVTKALEALSTNRDRHIPTSRCILGVVEGCAAPLLIEASRSAERLVVGSRGHGEFTGMLLESLIPRQARGIAQTWIRRTRGLDQARCPASRTRLPTLRPTWLRRRPNAFRVRTVSGCMRLDSMREEHKRWI